MRQDEQDILDKNLVHPVDLIKELFKILKLIKIFR